MGVRIEDIRIGNEFTTGSTDYLLGNIGEKINIEVDFSVEIFAIDDDLSQEITAFPNVSVLVTDRTRLITANSNVFASFSQGDDIQIVGTSSNNGTYNIIRKIDDFNIEVNTNLVNEDFPANAYIALITPISGITYRYNFIENNAIESFENLIDNDISALNTNSADATVLTDRTLAFTGFESNQIGGAIIRGRGISADGSQMFTIVHDTFITPFFLANQFVDLKNNTAPDYLNRGNSLRYILEIEAGRSLFNRNNVQTSLGFSQRIGSVGWFDENFNGNASRFSVSDLSYNNEQESILLNDTTELTLKVNSLDGVFSDGNTNISANFIYLPENEDDYQNNGRNLTENFLFDRGFNTLGSVTVGDNLGTDLQVINSIETTFVSANEIDVKVTFNVSQNYQDFLSSLRSRNFIFWLTTQDHTKTIEQSDRVNLLVDCNELFLSLTSTDLINSQTNFLQHYTDTETVKEFFMFPGDDVIARTNFSIDFNGLEEDNIRIVEITNKVILESDTGIQIELDRLTVNVFNSLLNGSGQFINTDINRSFRLPQQDIRNNLTIRSLPVNGTVYSWEMNFPFIKRFEFWRALSVRSLPSGLFDPNEPNNGINNDWEYLQSVLGYRLKYQVCYLIEQNGQRFTQEFSCNLFCCDYESNEDWQKNIEVFSLNGDNLGKNILSFENVNVKAIFEWVGSGSAPALDDIDGVIWANRTEIEGFESRSLTSSVNDTGIQIFSNGVTVTEPSSGVFCLEATIDSSRLIDTNSYDIQVRLHDKRSRATLN